MFSRLVIFNVLMVLVLMLKCVLFLSLVVLFLEFVLNVVLFKEVSLRTDSELV